MSIRIKLSNGIRVEFDREHSVEKVVEIALELARLPAPSAPRARLTVRKAKRRLWFIKTWSLPLPPSPSLVARATPAA